MNPGLNNGPIMSDGARDTDSKYELDEPAPALDRAAGSGTHKRRRI